MQTRAEKDTEIKNLTEKFQKTQVALCADYRGLTVAEITELRKQLRKGGAVGRVSKNNLARRAAEAAYKDADAAELQKLLATFKGPRMYVFSEADPVSPARTLAEFGKKAEKLQIQGGFFEGRFLSVSAVKDLATMPSKEESQAMLLRVMNGAAASLLRLMNEPASQLVRLLDARRKQLEEQGGAQA